MSKSMDEFDWEKSMRESDALTDKYLRLLEKYGNQPESEKLIAREMGWDWLVEALESQEAGEGKPVEEAEPDDDDPPALEPNPLTEGVDWVRDEDGEIHHPLAKRAFDLGVELWHYCDERGLMKDGSDPDLHEMVFQFQVTSAKLAGALNHLGYDGVDEPGFVVAALKRSLTYLNKSIGAAEAVATKRLLDPTRLDIFRRDFFDVREQILALMQRYRDRQT